MSSSRQGPGRTQRRLRVLALAALLFGISVPLVGLVPEVVYLTPDLNDGAFHLGVVRNTIAAIGEGRNPLDFWVPTWLSGFPLFHYYQPGPYLLTAAVHHFVGDEVSLLSLYRVLTILFVTLFPLTNYVALRWLGLERETAGCGALLACLISGNGSYGIEMGSFTWSGWGLFSQAAALPLLPLALAGGWRALQDGRRTLGYAAVLATAFLCHVLYGYITVLSLGIVPFLDVKVRLVVRRLLALARFYAQTFALIAFFVVPLVLDLEYHAKSLYDEAAKFDSHGAATVLTWLFSGALFDNGRLPVLTLLTFWGMYLCVRRWFEEHSRVHGWFVCGFVFWLLLYFGRATWGSLIDLLPMSRGLHMERLSNGVHMFGIWLAAVSLGSLLRWGFGAASRHVSSVFAVACAVLLLTPMVNERARYFARNSRLTEAAKIDYEREQADFAPVLRALTAAPGRVYAGHSGNWGATYRVGQVRVYHLLSAAAIAQVANAPYSWALTTDFQLQLQWPDLHSIDVYGIDYLLTNEPHTPPPGSRLVVHSGQHRLYRLRSGGPFGLVSVPVAMQGTAEELWYMTMSWVKGVWPRQRTHARLLLRGEQEASSPVIRMQGPFRYVPPEGGETRNVFEPPAVFMTTAPAPPSGLLREGSQGRDEATVVVEMQEPGVVLFKTTYHPGWRATVDGTPAAAMVLTPGLTGVEVPPGTHRLELRYEAGWLKMLLLPAGLFIALLLEWMPVRRTRVPV